MSIVRMIATAAGLALALACGPRVSVEVGSEGGSTMMPSSSSSTTTASATSSSSGVDESTTADALLLPPHAVITHVLCRQGSMTLYIEAIFEPLPMDCLDRPDAELLQIFVENWDGGPGMFIAHEDTDAQAQFGWQPLEGTFTLEVSEATQPSKVTVDLEAADISDDTAFVGVLDLQACPIASEAPCVGTSE